MDSQDYTQLLVHDTPMIDTRAPIEFSKGALPFSTSLPLMNDEERSAVGTCYKQKGQAAAIALGHQLVSGTIKESRIKAWIKFINQYPNGFLYCWRGGLRSQTVQTWLKEAGYPYPRVIGGYKALRTHLIREQARILQQTPLLILAGHTGAAKTKLLHTLNNSIDLEGLANHKGSTFGKHPSGQPTQLNFENTFAIALLKHDYFRQGQTLILEDESRLIGRINLPLDLQKQMSKSAVIQLTAPINERIEHSYQNYILSKLAEWEKILDKDSAYKAFSEELKTSMSRIQKRLGGMRYQEVSLLLEQALSEHAKGNPNPHRQWIEYLLVNYYDPMYEYQLTQKQDRIIFKGDENAVRSYLLQQ